jgi:hypothetical protein
LLRPSSTLLDSGGRTFYIYGVTKREITWNLLSLACVILLAAIASCKATPSGQDTRAETSRGLLGGAYPKAALADLIVPAADWHPFPRADEREAWLGLPETIRADYIARAEKHLGAEWATPKASVFLEYVRNGNRSNFEAISFGRRGQLADLVLGECMEGKGRFLEDIVNGIWTISEETYWGVPAHVGAQRRGSGLPDVTEPTVDLFAAETGMLLAWTDYLLGARLDQVSPLVRERIVYEVARRLLTPCLERDDFWWMGLSGRAVNNWNPWICSNWLTSVLLLEKEPARRTASVDKILRCLDVFLEGYPADGGCDEGPGYWGRAGASLFDCLELLESASNGRINVFDRPLIREMGRYIARVYIAYPYFINFADAAARVTPDASLVFRYGQRISDKSLAGFGAFLAKKQGLGRGAIRGSFGVLGRVLPALFSLDDLMRTEPHESLQRDFWLPGLQVFGARSLAGSNRGFYVAAKGGHNAESHNHNDVGNFVVFADGKPVLVDVGVETYTAKTFSDRRYEIWTMQSAFHNLPTINGFMQKDGRQHAARAVTYAEDDATATFSLDIAPAYPEEAGVKTWQRTVTLERGRGVVVEDSYTLSKVKEDLRLSLMSWRRPETIGNGSIRLLAPEGEGPLNPVFISFDGSRFRASVETIPLEDAHLRSSWGPTLYRIILTAKETRPQDRFSIAIRY